MRMILAVIVFGWLTVGGSVVAISKTSTAVEKVVVRDAEFKLLKTLETASELAEFNRIWVQKGKEAEPLSVELPTQYKLDVSVNGQSTRYLYEPDGRTRVLTKGPAPVFRVKDVGDFNQLLGVVTK
jgi:hypothetical protein